MAPYTEEDGRQALLDRRGHLTQYILAGCKLEFTNSAIADYVFWTGKNVYSIKSQVETAKSVVEGVTPAAHSAARRKKGRKPAESRAGPPCSR